MSSLYDKVSCHSIEDKCECGSSLFFGNSENDKSTFRCLHCGEYYHGSSKNGETIIFTDDNKVKSISRYELLSVIDKLSSNKSKEVKTALKELADYFNEN